MKYTIPSSGRSDIIDNVADLVGRKNLLVYVKEHEYEIYRRHLAKENLVTIPDETHGMGAIRKIMLEDNLNEDYVFQLDDDAKAIEYKFTGRIGVDDIVNSDHVMEIVQNMYQVALDIGTPLFTFTAAIGPLHYTQLDMCHFSGTINVGYGIIPALLGSIMFDPRMVINEDQDFSLQCKYYNRYFFIDNRYAIRVKEFWKQLGGCSTIRNEKTMKDCDRILRQKWGSVIHTSSKKENQHVLAVPF